MNPAVPVVGAPAPSRGRRTPRPTGDDRQVAILATAERLLADRTLADISIDDLARGAGISRPTFYFYFASKEAVLLALLDRVAAEASQAAAGVLDQLPADPRAGWRAAIGSFHDTFGAHRSVLLAVARARGTHPEVDRLWASILEVWVARTAEAIDAERARGAAVPGPPARELAVALNLMNERVLYAAFAGDRLAVAGAQVVDVLLEVWLGSMYRSSAPPVG